MNDGIDPIVQHPSVPRDRSRDWALAQGTRRPLSCGALAATRRAIQEHIAAIERGDARGNATVISNLNAALRALEGCRHGEFLPLHAVHVVTATEWDALRDELKDGDPARGTARFARKPGDEMVRCLVVPDDEA